MSELRKLFRIKRILAMVLAAALAVTSVPATALAAAPDEIGQTVQEDAEDNSVDEDADAALPDTSSDDTSELPDGQDDDLMDAEAPAVQEDASAADDAQKDDASTSADVQDDVSTDDAAQADAEEEEIKDIAQPQEDGAEQAIVTPVIESDESYERERVYNLGNPLFANSSGKGLDEYILTDIYISLDGNRIYLGTTNEDITQTVTYQWVAGETKLDEPKKLSEESDKFPTEAGDYKLVFSLPAKEGAYAAATGEFDFKITKAEVTYDFYTSEPVAPGTAKKNVLEGQNYDVYYLYGEDGKSFTYVIDDPETKDVDESKDNEVKFTAVIKNAETGAALDEDDILTAENEYVLTMSPEFIGAKKAEYEKNYSFVKCAEQKLEIGELKASKLTLTLDSKYNDPAFKTTLNAEVLKNDNGAGTMVHVIEADSVEAVLDSTTKKPAYTMEVSVENGEDEKGAIIWKSITPAETDVKGTWYTAADYTAPWKEADKTYCKLTLGSELTETPALPGVYVYRVSYAGNQTEYAASYADIVVVVEKAEIVVRPTIAKDTKFYDKQSVKDVLAKITYELPYADGRQEGEKEALYPVTDNMWGTSYVGKDKTQPYKPDFELVEIIKDQDGKEISHRTYGSNGYDIDNGYSGYLNFQNEYFVRFNGKKSVYYASGSPADSCDINATVDSMDTETCGFEVKTGEEVYEQYKLKIDVNEVNQEIVTDDIRSAAEKAGMTSENVGALEGVLSKIYDGNKMFANYADYQKAKLKSGQSDANTSFFYNWEKSYYSYEELTETMTEGDQEVFVIDKETAENSFSTHNTSISPMDAGVYRLKIALRDLDGANYAEPAYVYFLVKQQEITVTFSGKAFTDNAGNTQSIFLENHQKELSEGTTVTLMEGMDGKPSKAEDWKNFDGLSEPAAYAYKVMWTIKEKQKNPDGTDMVDGDGKPVPPVEIGRWDTLTTDADKYVLSVDAIQAGKADDSKYGGFNLVESDNYKVKFEIPDIPITVEAMGEAEVKFAGITTTDGKTLDITKTYDAKSVYEMIKDQLAVMNAPITVQADGKTKDKDVTFADGERGLVYTVSGNGEKKVYEGKLPIEEADWEWTKNAAYYSITVKYNGNKNYAALSETVLAEIIVEPKELLFTMPELSLKFKVGDSVGTVMSAAQKVFDSVTGDVIKAVEGEIPEADQKYFTRSSADYALWVGFDVWDSVYGDFLYDYEDVLQQAGNKRYILSWNCSLWSGDEDLDGNYQIVYAEPESAPIEVGRGRAVVAMQDYQNTKLDITDPEPESDDAVLQHNVTVEDGIPYSNGTPEGNIVKISITAPYDEEIDAGNVIYAQSIKNHAKERLIGEPRITVNDNGESVVTFTYDATGVKDDLLFSIRWAEDYNEDFTLLFGDAVKLGNLKDAVAPKSLAFNAPLTTMVVGQEQELDVKITKEQTADIICLGYEVTDGKEYMHVNEYGKVTALKAGKATVSVYPMHLVDGKKTRIDGAKAASVKITVKEVPAPKVSKVVSYDRGVRVQYALPKETDGYRREIYVVEGKNVKADEIKKMVESMQNEQWKGIFAVAPVFLSYSDEVSSRVYDAKKHTNIDVVSKYLGGLEPTKDYTVYVRNVSAMRSFEDGCTVSLSAAGTAKGFTTTKIQVSDITATLKDKEIGAIDYELVDGFAPTQEDIREAGSISYVVPLAENSVSISLEGLFTDVAGDGHYEAIPFNNAEAKKNYVAPKMAYCFHEWMYEGYDIYGNPVHEDYAYVATSSLVTIDKKGKVTFKQPGTVSIYAYDTVSGEMSQEIVLSITAEADSMKAKNTTLSVGQSIRLERLVDYKQGKKSLDQSCYDTYNRIDVKAAQEKLGSNKSFGISDDGYLTAYAKDNITLELKDTLLNQTVSVRVKSTDLAPVKNLKAANLIDNRFDVQFEANMYAEAYRIEVSDAKKLIRSIYVENLPFSNNEQIFETTDWYTQPEYADWRPAVGDDDDWGSSYGYYQEWNDSFLHDNQHWVKSNYSVRCDLTNGKWVFSYRINGLTQTSKYNIKVTALYGGVSSKTMSKAVTTTKLPAYDYPITSKLGKSTRNEYGYKYAQGMSIYAAKNTGGAQIGNFPFISGNTYNLWPNNYNTNARYAGTDTLTWTSSNKKVATVQATSGGYSASLKALKDGETVIEVKSKVLKNVIARYTITVLAVGDAYTGRNYWGDNQDFRGDGDGKETPVTELIIGVPVAVELSAGQSKKFRFTTTEEGIYSMYKTVEGTTSSFRTSTCSGGSELVMEATLSGPVTGSVVVKRDGSVYGDTGAANRKEISLNKTVSYVPYNTWYVFTAPEDGMYGVQRKYNGIASVTDEYVNVYVQDTKAEGGWTPNTTTPAQQAFFYQLKKGDMVYLQATSSLDDMTVVKADFTELKAGESFSVSSMSEKWFEFTPTEQDQYAFTGLSYDSITVYDSDFTTKSYDSYENEWDSEAQRWLYSYTYTLSDKVYIRVKNAGNTINMSVKKRSTYQQFAEDGTYTINREFTGYDDYLYITYTVKEDGFYTFASDIVTDVSGRAYLDVDDESEVSDWYIGSSEDKISEYYLTTGQKVCVRVQSCDYPATWTGVKITAVKTGNAPEAISMDGTAATVKAAAGQSAWYSFKAAEEGEYEIAFLKSENGTGDISVEVYGNVSDSSPIESSYVSLQNGGFMSSPITVNAGDVRYLKLENSSSDDKELQVKIYKIPNNVTVVEDTPAELNLKENWVSFTATDDAYYTFAITANAGNIGNGFSVYENKNGTFIASSADGTISMALDQGTNVWLKATAEYPAGANEEADQLSVTKLGNVNTVSAVGDAENLTVISEESSYYAIVKFTANSTEDYTFKCSDTNMTGMDMYRDYTLATSIATSTSSSVDSTTTYTLSYNIAAGDTVYVKMNLNAESTSLTLTIATGTEESGGDSGNGGDNSGGEGGEVTP